MREEQHQIRILEERKEMVTQEVNRKGSGNGGRKERKGKEGKRSESKGRGARRVRREE